ncbi:FtsX-like permease family protein [bacterium]|nr:FtsX-like permease family protein [bacterium]MBU1957152.1 FtsX-like permease family protein [bacterium]
MFHLALKNILFYKGRSIATLVLTFLSALFFIVYVSMMDGSHNAMLQNSLKIYTGAIEIYKKGYRDIGGNEYLLNDVESITQKLDKIEGIEAYSPRYETYGLLSSKEQSTASMVVGIDPKKEQQLNELSSALVEGKYLDGTNNNCLYSGVDLVSKLKVKLGNEIAFIGSASDNSFAADIFKLCGIFKTGLFEFDASSSFVDKNYLDTLMYTQNKASYITLKLDDINDADKVNKDINSILDNEVESLTWKTLMSSMVELLEVDSIFGYVSLSLFFVVIFFVIMIYGFINVSSRTKEFGVLRSIGLSRGNIRKLLFYEIFILSSIAILLATPIGAYITYYYSLNPIIIEGIAETYKQYGIVSDEMPFSFDMFTISWNVLVIYGLNFLSILYPMVYINSFNPIEAMGHV